MQKYILIFEIASILELIWSKGKTRTKVEAKFHLNQVIFKSIKTDSLEPFISYIEFIQCSL